MSVKEEILQAIERLPSDVDYRDVAEEIAFLSALKEAESDIEGGRLVSNDEMKTRISGWAAN